MIIETGFKIQDSRAVITKVSNCILNPESFDASCILHPLKFIELILKEIHISCCTYFLFSLSLSLSLSLP